MSVLKLNSNDIAISISTNLTTPAYKELVCGEDITVDGSVDVNRRTTKCGDIIGTRNPSFSVSASGVANTTPTSGTEISANELMTIFKAGADILVKIHHRADPTKYYRQFQGIITAYTEDAPEGDVVGFDLTIEMSSGTLDEVS